MKRLINIKTYDNKCFLWCHIRHLNLVKRNPEKITKEDKKMIDDLHYEGIKFPVPKKDYCRIERQNHIFINVFCYENGLAYPVYVSDQKFHNSMDLLLISDENKSHYVYIRNCNRFMGKKQKIKIKNISANVVHGVLAVKKVPFKIHVHFKCILKGVKSSDENNGSYTEKYQAHIPSSFA